MKVLVLMGATATGKSGLAVNLAEAAGREIISADSRQIYHGLRVGTAQASLDDRSRVKHHLLDFLSPDDTWSAQEFADAALEIIRAQASNPPIVVGGTGFWLRSMMEGLFPLDISREESLKAREKLEIHSSESLYARLEAEDRATAERLHPNDRQRVLRALEVLDATGIPLSVHHKESRRKPRGIDWTVVVLTCERARLHERIEKRLHEMLESAWPAEVSSLLESGVDPDSPGMQALGYPEVVAMLKGNMTANDAQDRILYRTRQYARRQEIWFRKEENAQVLDAEDSATPHALAQLLSS